MRATDHRIRTAWPRQCAPSKAPRRSRDLTVRVVAILIAGGDHQHSKAQDISEAVPDALRRTWVVDAGSEALGQAEPLLDLAQGQQAAIGGELPAIEAGDQGHAGDR
jgi:hypothetical protein